MTRVIGSPPPNETRRPFAWVLIILGLCLPILPLALLIQPELELFSTDATQPFVDQIKDHTRLIFVLSGVCFLTGLFLPKDASSRYSNTSNSHTPTKNNHRPDKPSVIATPKPATKSAVVVQSAVTLVRRLEQWFINKFPDNSFTYKKLDENRLEIKSDPVTHAINLVLVAMISLILGAILLGFIGQVIILLLLIHTVNKNQKTLVIDRNEQRLTITSKQLKQPQVIPFDHIEKILVEKIEPLTRSAKAKPYQISIVLNNGKTLALDQEFQTADLEEKLKLLKYFITDAYSGDAAQSAEVERSYMSKATILDETDLASEINPSANDSELFKLDHHSSDFEQQLEWTPLRTDYSRSNGFKCHQLNDDQMLIQIEPSTQGQGVIYLLISVAVFFLGLATSLGGVYFFAFLGFIAAMLALFNRGEFYLADKSSGCLTPVNSKPSSNAFPKHAISGREQIDLSDIQCLQVLTYTATLSATKGTQYAAVDEINLVLKSSDRINLTREQSKPELITEAERLGRFLQLPVYYQNHA